VMHLARTEPWRWSSACYGVIRRDRQHQQRGRKPRMARTAVPIRCRTWRQREDVTPGFKNKTSYTLYVK
jgi:hypothetical protein